MTMDDEGVAAEYALGTLDAEERAQADAMLLVDADFAAEVARWERRLGELNVLVAPIEPPPPVWDKILAGVAEAAPSEPMRLPQVAAPAIAAAAETGEPSAEIIDLTQRMRRWRGLTVMSGALAASIVAIVAAREYRPDVLPADWRPKQLVVEKVVEKPVEVVREVVREVLREVPAQPAQYVAVFQKDEQSPSFVMSVDIEKRTVTVRQVAAERFADKTYQLWIATQPGAAPQSLGVLGGEDFTVRAALTSYEPAVINNATFGISLEPLGGSPTGQPTSPAIHAKLLQVTPPK